MNSRINQLENISRVLAKSASHGSSDFDLDPGGWASLRATHSLREAAVLVPLIKGESGLQVVLTKRASHLKHHPGQIAFPGGKVDDADHNHTATALREAHEEIGLDPKKVKILGQIPFHETVTSFRITPIVGLIDPSFAPVSEPGEVEEVFRVPLAYLTDPRNYRVEGRIWGGARRQYYTIPYGPYYIWGATARIMRGFAEMLNP